MSVPSREHFVRQSHVTGINSLKIQDGYYLQYFTYRNEQRNFLLTDFLKIEEK